MIKRAFLCAALCLLLPAAGAAPSISTLETVQKIEIVAGEGAAALCGAVGEDGVCTSRALPEQYEQYDDAQAQYSATVLEAIRAAEATFAETGTNGHTIVESIPSLEEIFSGATLKADAELASLKQLTYMQDFKRASTGYRIAADGADGDGIEIKVEGSELLRSAAREDFVILQMDPRSGEAYALPMKSYAPETGAFSAVFHCLGPYIIALRT